jgi:hypothetical protein
MTTDERPHLRKARDADTHPTAVPLYEDTIFYGSTADAVVKEKLVTLEVDIPKSLRTSLRTEAKRRGISVDALVTQLLRARR